MKKVSFQRLFIAIIALCTVFIYSFLHFTPSYIGFINFFSTSAVGEKSNGLEGTKFYICPSFEGGLGNQMFQFASTYGIARFKGMAVLMSSNCLLTNVFNLSNVTFANTLPYQCKRPFKTLKEISNAVFDEKLTKFNVSYNVKLLKYLQSFRYFDRYATEVRKQFRFRNRILSIAKHIFESSLERLNITCNRHPKKYKYLGRKRFTRCYSLLGDMVTIVGSHVRRGDWLTPPHPKLGFQTATTEYLTKAVHWYNQRYANVVFIVASNDMQWTKENFPKNNPVIFLNETNAPSVDLAVLSLCNHFLATVGTFSWWAGWLIDGNVTYYKWPARENSRYRPTFGTNFSDHFYHEWVGL